MAIKINVGELFRSEPGTRINYKITLPVFDDNEFKLLPDQTLNITGYKIDKGVALSTEDETIKGEATCVKTLKSFILESELYPSERQFYLDKPDDLEDADLYDKIDNKTFEVDIEEMLREAVFLGLPTVIVSPDAENLEVKSVEIENSNTTKPFSGLKDMLKE